MPDAVIIQPPPEVWVRKLFHRIPRVTWVYIGVTVFVVGNILIAQTIRRQQTLTFRSQAAVGQAKIFIQPATQVLSSGSSYQVWLTVDQPISFVHTEITFDPKLLKLTQEVDWVSTALTRNMMMTTMAQANTTGKIIMIVALDPAKKDNPPSGTFQLAALHFMPNTTASNVSAPITFITSALQLVNADAIPFGIVSTGATAQINLVPTPTPTPSCVPANGTWQYGSWSTCSTTCGGGVQTRTVQCAGATCGGICPGSAVVTQSCNIEDCSTNVTIIAAGSVCRGEYPSMQLVINDQIVSKWTNIKGNPTLRVFNQYTYQSPGDVTPDQVKVRFTNDCYAPPLEDRNLRVDKITINGMSYESEAKSTYSTGTWSRGSGCKEGYKLSEWLHCGGYFQY